MVEKVSKKKLEEIDKDNKKEKVSKKREKSEVQKEEKKQAKEKQLEELEKPLEIKEKKEESLDRKAIPLKEAIKQLRNEEKRNFVQTLDLIINLKKFDARKEQINNYVYLVHPLEKRICAFLTKKIKGIDVITKEEFDLYKNQREIKKLAKKYDMFIAVAPLMTQIAAKFGRALGPSGKMPSPSLGVITKEDEETIASLVDKMKRAVRIRTKERSIKIPVGKESMSDEQLEDNVKSAVNSVIDLLPQKKENIKNIIIKFTMTKPVEISLW